MANIQIVPMVIDEDINGKDYVHWKPWHEIYTGLVNKGRYYSNFKSVDFDIE